MLRPLPRSTLFPYTTLFRSVSTRTDHGRITYSTRKFVRCSTGRSRCSEVPLRIPRHGADRSVTVRIRDNEFFAAVGTCFLRRFQFLQCVPALLREKIFRVDQLDPVAFGEFLGTAPNHHHML